VAGSELVDDGPWELVLRGARRASTRVGRSAGWARAPQALTPIGRITKQSHSAGFFAGYVGPEQLGGGPLVAEARRLCLLRQV
jgi:hypothetical protein